MATSTVTLSPAEHKRLDLALESGRYFTQHAGKFAAKYAGKWVVIRGTELIASDADARVAIAEAIGKGHDPQECLVQFIPEKGQRFSIF